MYGALFCTFYFIILNYYIGLMKICHKINCELLLMSDKANFKRSLLINCYMYRGKYLEWYELIQNAFKVLFGLVLHDRLFDKYFEQVFIYSLVSRRRYINMLKLFLFFFYKYIVIIKMGLKYIGWFYLNLVNDYSNHTLSKINIQAEFFQSPSVEKNDTAIGLDEIYSYIVLTVIVSRAV